ncbi:hypothetical protein, partial [Bacteroides thetaiotaomicron]|uniref:hypothetical protein n=1 Tax=Bacteroides thetaiotaomicron TaxID=818 RepID=UPI00374E21F1
MSLIQNLNTLYLFPGNITEGILYHEVVSKRWHNLFLCTKPRLSQARALLLPKVFVSLGIKFFVMAKLHFRPYIPNQTVLFPGRIDENIA